ncbi:gas vesicle structural protein GvpA [Kribbella pittospori]|uniref:Gas vesicle protein A n=1 Tax=Kribbella pittospori TaxID=722689 RepID=A0A4R0K9U4_9ACTN|nr:gas vesicle protein GvpJ [Kribbella pittospori]TCC54956.1 gas vesicle structural protein GvpA [Kribbella pittospori]
MTVAATGQRRSGGYLERPAPSSLADVIDSILDKGLVIDAYVRVSLVGIELLTIDARIVIASVDTYLRFAEATNRLDLYEKGGKDLPELVEGISEGGASGKTRGLLSGAKEALLGSDGNRGSDRDDDEEEPEHEERPRRRPAKKAAARRRRAEE